MHHFLSSFITRFVLKRIRETSEAKPGVVALPKQMLALGIVCCILLAALGVIFLFTPDAWIGAVIMFALALLSGSMIVAYFNQRVVYDDETFTQSTFFGTKRTFTYADITGMRSKDGIGDTRLFAGGHSIFMDNMAVGTAEFLKHASQKYAELHDGAPIPDVAPRAKSNDLFRGNVTNPGEWIALFIIVGVCILGVCVLLCVSSWPQKVDVAALSEYKVEIGEAYLDDGTLELYTVDGRELYRLPDYEKAVPDTAAFEAHLRSSGVLVLRVSPASKENVYNIAYMAAPTGTVFLTPEDVDRTEQENFVRTAILSGVFLVLAAAFIVFVIYVGRNPKKFSPNLVNKIFKEGTLRT